MCCHWEHAVACIKYRQGDDPFVYYCLTAMNWQRRLADTDVYIRN